MKLKRLTTSTEFNLSEFDCGDQDLNAFLNEDAINFQSKRIANTFILEDEGMIVAYFCLLNDKISRLEITNSKWKTIKDSFPENKRFRSYPSIKIGRLAVSIKYRGLHLGTKIMDLIKASVNRETNLSAFRFITVDAYISAIDFYKKCGFKELTEKDDNEHTRLMYFDMMEFI